MGVWKIELHSYKVCTFVKYHLWTGGVKHCVWNCELQLWNAGVGEKTEGSMKEEHRGIPPKYVILMDIILMNLSNYLSMHTINPRIVEHYI